MLQSEFVQRVIFFLLLGLLSIASVVGTFVLTHDLATQTATFAIAALVAILGTRVALFSSITENRVRLTVLLITGAVCLAVVNAGHAGPVLDIVNAILKRLGIGSLPVESPDLQPWLKFGALLAIIIVSVAVVLSLRHGAAMGRPARPLEDVLDKVVTDRNRIQNLKDALRDHLDATDRSTQWSDTNYVPLQAQVQMLEGRTSRPKIVDLLKALRGDQRTRVFIVLGEPGSGKSVAMRKLARDLLRESGRRDRIPVYINLKEWTADHRWTPDSPPSSADFDQFVRKNILTRLDMSLTDFLLRKGDDGHDNFERLRESGFFFFVLDSFDEIPAVLDEDESSWLIESLSDLIARHIVTGVGARGVIASRLFRQPRIVHQDRSVYEIRPFTDDRLIKVIQNTSHDPKRLIDIVLTKRPDLGIVARNPLLLNLLIVHFNEKLDPPTSQKEMFETYLAKSIALARSLYKFSALSNAELYSICENIAQAIFEQQRAGLEIAHRDLRRHFCGANLEDALEFLVRSRIGRSSLDSGAFSFSHRRFNEYFLVRGFDAGSFTIPIDAIQTDSRWRDSLVLYSEIASDDKARSLVDHAWRFVAHLENTGVSDNRFAFIEGRRAVRFLIEGFRNRPHLLWHIRPDLTRLVAVKINEDLDYIETKAFIDTIALLSPSDAHAAIVKVLDRYSGWLSEGAATAARYLPIMDWDLSFALYKNCIKRPALESLREAGRQSRILSLSDSTKEISRWLKAYRFDVFKSAVITAIIYCTIFILRDVMFLLAAMGGIVISVIWFSSPDNEPHTISHRALIAAPTASSGIVGAFVLFIIGLNAVSPGPYFNGPISALVLALCIVGILPTRRVFWRNLLLALKNNSWLDNAMTASLVALFIAVIGAIIASVVLLVHWVSGDVFTYAILPGLSIIVLATIALMLATLFTYMRDWVQIIKLKRSFDPRRENIATSFLSLKTPFFRMRYVIWLEQISVHHHRALSKLANGWPNNKRPQISGDEASTELARLDAKWQGLE